MTLRLDRLATLYLFGPLARIAARNTALPILMYHSIAEEDESSTGDYFRTATSPKLFATHMELLRTAGYSTVTVSEAVEHMRNGSAGQQFVCITFDDGYRNFYTDAFPVLQQYGFTATMYLPTDFIGSTHRRFKDRDCLSWSEVRELHRHGIAFGSHTMSHPKLYGMSWTEIRRELAGSQDVIQQELGAPVESFAYPYAFPGSDQRFKAQLREILAETYRNSVCTTIGRCGPESDPYFLNRLPVNSADDNRLFEAKLVGGYDWLAVPQYLRKLSHRAAAVAAARS